jgi:hypothetical protein
MSTRPKQKALTPAMWQVLRLPPLARPPIAHGLLVHSPGMALVLYSFLALEFLFGAAS